MYTPYIYRKPRNGCHSNVPSKSAVSLSDGLTPKTHRIRYRAASYHTIPKLLLIESQNMVAMATSLRYTGYRQYLHSVGRPLIVISPSITNCLVAVVHTKQVIVILVPKLVAMATTHKHSISAMSLLDSLTRKPTPIQSNTVSRYNQSYIAHRSEVKVFSLINRNN